MWHSCPWKKRSLSRAAARRYVTGRTSFVLLDATSGQELRCWDDPAAGYAEHLALALRGERFTATLFGIRSRGQIAIVNAQSGQIERTVPIMRPKATRSRFTPWLTDRLTQYIGAAFAASAHLFSRSEKAPASSTSGV